MLLLLSLLLISSFDSYLLKNKASVSSITLYYKRLALVTSNIFTKFSLYYNNQLKIALTEAKHSCYKFSLLEARPPLYNNYAYYFKSSIRSINIQRAKAKLLTAL